MTVRQTAADLPGAEDVFRRYGELDAPPARFGHLEPLTHFARRRGVPLERLASELAEATGAPVDRRGRIAETIHHGFLLSSLAITLTLGAGWGAWLLWRIGVGGRFESASAAQVVAHGEAQLWGFVVLFVMGVSFRTLLYGVAQRPWGVPTCRALLALALGGVGGSLVWALTPGSPAWLGIASGAMLATTALGYWGVQAVFLHRKWRSTWVRAVLASGFWLSTWAAATVWLRWYGGEAGPGAYRDDQRQLLIELTVLGFAMNSIYGFGQMLLPGLLRIGSTRDGAIELGHWIHNAGVALACLATLSVVGSWGMIVGSLALTAGGALFVFGHRGFAGRRRGLQVDEKGHSLLDWYPPVAFFWLLTALVLMTGGALYQAAQGPLPHAYTGAVRHALTVGFMTTLILGVAQRMTPVLDRTVLAIPALSAPILGLIGVGNLWRVSSELATLATPSAYAVMPYSALLEWSALLLFAVNVWKTMYHRDPLLTRGRVTRRSSLAVLLAEHPWIEDRLRPTGTRYLERTRSVPSELTIGTFAEGERLNPDEMVRAINDWLANPEASAPTVGSVPVPGPG